LVSNIWVGWLDENSTDISICGSDLEIAIITPVLAPRILAEEVVTMIWVSTIAVCKDTVISVFATRCGGNDSVIVVLEDCLVCFDVDGYWSFGDGCLECGSALGSYIGARLNLSRT